MKAPGHTELTITELPDELQFRVVRHASPRDWMNWFTEQLVTLLPALGLFLIYAFWRGRSGPWALVGLLGGSLLVQLEALLAHWLHGPATELRIATTGLVATGNFGRNIFSNKAIVPWPEVKILGWAQGGLCAVRNGLLGRTTCVLPGLNEEQAKAVRTAISDRFPEVALKVRPGITVSDYAATFQRNPDTRQ